MPQREALPVAMREAQLARRAARQQERRTVAALHLHRDPLGALGKGDAQLRLGREAQRNPRSEHTRRIALRTREAQRRERGVALSPSPDGDGSVGAVYLEVRERASAGEIHAEAWKVRCRCNKTVVMSLFEDERGEGAQPMRRSPRSAARAFAGRVA